MKESIEEATLEQSAALTKSIDYLSIIGASAPMLRFAWNGIRYDQGFSNNGNNRYG